MVHTATTPDKPTISYEIPEYYLGRQIEIIAFVSVEGAGSEMPMKKKVSFMVLHVEANDYSFNRDEANERKCFS